MVESAEKPSGTEGKNKVKENEKEVSVGNPSLIKNKLIAKNSQPKDQNNINITSQEDYIDYDNWSDVTSEEEVEVIEEEDKSYSK